MYLCEVENGDIGEATVGGHPKKAQKRMFPHGFTPSIDGTAPDRSMLRRLPRRILCLSVDDKIKS